MKKNMFSDELFLNAPLVGIIRNIPFEIIKKILPVYVDSGLTTIEITMNTPEAEDIIQYAIQQYGDILNIGAGTVCDEHHLEKALQAGAGFIVSPVVNESVLLACVEKKIPIFPGAYTPTEIYRCWSLGAYMVKVFPATSLGACYIKEVKAPLNDIKLLPTGGVDLENIKSFFNAGASGVGMSGQLFNKTYIVNENWNKLREHFKLLLDKLPGRL